MPLILDEKANTETNVAEQVPNTPIDENRQKPNDWARESENLDHLLPPSSVETPLYLALINSIKDLINPPKLPPLEITSKPVEVPTMRGLYSGNEWKAGAVSVGINAGIIGLLLLIGTNPTIQELVKENVTLIAPVMPKPIVATPKKQTQGGGGGSPVKAPDAKGELPKKATRDFVAPRIEKPKLEMQASIMIGEDLPQISASNIGNPNAGIGIPGAGSGIGTGIGPGKGSGIGPGSGGGYGGGAFRIGGGVSAPVALVKPEPEYSEEARKAKYQGEVTISLIVDEKGKPQNMQVVKKLGLGLDEKALEAVAKWVFKPGMKDGKPVPVQATIAVSFRLL